MRSAADLVQRRYPLPAPIASSISLRLTGTKPGLARKNNGCTPPGQAKKWRVGQRLPRDVIYQNLPRQLVVDLGPPPSGYRFVRVAENVLMIAVGTGMVLDAINDIGGLSNP